MKQLYKGAYWLACGLALILAVPVANAQQKDTLTVEWFDEAANDLAVNSLYEAIVGDTLSDGTRVPNRAYKLQQGGFYYLTETIQNDGYALDIVGEPGDPSDAFANPPMIQVVTREDGSAPGKMFAVRGDFSLKNVIVNGKTSAGSLNYEIIEVRNDGVRVVFDHVIFEYAQWAIMGVYSKGADLFVTNSHFRNFLSETQPWGGRGFSVWADADTVWFENNTFHDVGGFTAQIEGASANLFWFNHNTVVNNGRQLVLGGWLKDAYITNNLILNGFWQGEAAKGSQGEISADRLASEDEQYAGMFAITNLPASYGLDAQRNIAIANNSFYLESAFTDFFAADQFEVRKQPLLNVKTQNLFDANPNMVVKDNLFDTQNPGFTAYANNHAERYAFITAIRAGTTPTMYYWDPGRDSDNLSIQWPLPEDLTYSNATLKTAAIGGYPMGNLNWYPDAKATWESNRAAQQDAIKNLLGEPITVDYVGFVEAEAGVLGGAAENTGSADANRLRARIEASGDVLWSDVQIATAGSYDVEVSLRTWWDDGSAGRATNLVVNGASTNFPRGGTGDQFNTAKIPAIAFNAGANEVKLGRSWGYLEYQWVKVYEAGTTNLVATLWPGEGELVGGGSYQCATTLCMSGDRYVDTKTGGSVTISPTAEAGSHVVRITYVLAAGAQTAAITVNGSSAGTVELTGASGAKLQVDVPGLTMNAGANEIKVEVSGGGAWIDRFDIFKVSGGSATSIEDVDMVEEFRLEQNYPNPFNPSTLINFTIPMSSDVKLTVYNLLGQRVATLVNGTMSAGAHSVRFDGAGLASGIYLYRLEAGSFVSQKKMMLVK